MKKILFGTTALAAIGLLAGGAQAASTGGPIQVTIGGYFYGFLQGVSQSSNAGEPGNHHKSLAITDKSRISFQGKATLDNGLKAGFVVNLRGESMAANIPSLNSADQIDDHFVYLDSATYGRVELGATSSAPRKMFYGPATPLAPAAGLNSPNFLWFANTANPLFQPSTLVDFGGADRATKITYFTPRVAGFQLGISYAPTNCYQNEESILGNGNNTSPGFGGGTPQTCIFFGGTPMNNTVGEQDNVIEGALNYAGNFNGLGVGAYVGGGHATLSGQAINGATLRNKQQYAGGFRVTYAGFTFGSSVKFDNLGTKDGISATSPMPTNRWDANVGLMYTTGPWSIGASYAYSQEKEVNNVGTSMGKDKMNAEAIGVNYVLGPGINLVGGVEHLDYKGYKGAPSSFKDSGFLYTVGTVLNF